MLTVDRLRRLRPVMPAHLPTTDLFGGSRIEGFFDPTFVPRRTTADGLRVVARQHYYEIDKRGYGVGTPQPDKTINMLLTISTPSGQPARLIGSSRVAALNGVEDPRLYDHLGEVLFFGNVYRPEGGEHINRPVVGRLGWVGDELREGHVADVTERIAKREKNWVFYKRGGELRMEKLPGLRNIYRIDPSTLEARYIGADADEPFFWSGTKSVELDGGTLFLDHLRVYMVAGLTTMRRYIYRLRWLPDDGDALRTSHEFSLGDHSQLCYVSDIMLHRDRLLFGCGVNERSFTVHAAALTAVRQMIGLR